MQGQTTSANCSIAQRAGISALRAGNESATYERILLEKEGYSI